MKTKHVVTEWRGHQDEYCALWQAERFGEAIFQGIRLASLSFADKEPGAPQANTLYIGVGNAEKYPLYGQFNEHRPYGRLQGTCAAMMMAQYLRILNKPRVRDLLREVLASDIEPKTYPTQLASLIKMMHRVKKGQDQLGTYHWATRAFDAIAFNDADPSVDVRILWKEYCNTMKVPAGREFVRANQMVNESFYRRNGLVTELSAIVSRMSPVVVYPWLEEVFSMMLEDAKIFQEAVKEMNSESVVAFDIQTENEHGLEPAYFVVTDSEHAGKAASSILTGKATVCVVRSTKGHTQVYSNPLLKLPMNECAALLRMAEFRKWTGKLLSYKKAQGGGTIPECRQWHLPNPNMILNGSLTHPWIAPSKLDFEEIQDIVYHAFTASGRDIWIKRYYDGQASIDQLVTGAIDLGSVLDGDQERKV